MARSSVSVRNGRCTYWMPLLSVPPCRLLVIITTGMGRSISSRSQAATPAPPPPREVLVDEDCIGTVCLNLCQAVESVCRHLDLETAFGKEHPQVFGDESPTVGDQQTSCHEVLF